MCEEYFAAKDGFREIGRIGTIEAIPS
jgi:hypothetical protein